MLNKLNYIPMKTKITSENLNEIQDEIIKNSLDLQNFESQLEQIESNINNIDKVAIKNISCNLINTPIFTRVNTNWASYEKIDDITYKVSCTASWGGTFNHQINASYKKTYMIICKVKAFNDESIGKYCNATFYQYKDNTNLGDINNPNTNYYTDVVELESDYKLLYYGITTNKEDITRLDVGVSGSSGATFIMTEPIILDVTPLTFDELKGIHFPQFGYWSDYIDNFVNAKYSLNSKTSEISLNLHDEAKNAILNTASKISQKYTDDKIRESLSIPFINETDKLSWNTKTYLLGDSTKWWVENKSKDLTPNSTYIYVVKWIGQNQSSFERCNELRDDVWHNATTFTNQYVYNDDMKVMSWIFTTDSVVTSPSLCCVTNNPTLTTDVTISVELYKIIDENYVSVVFATDIAKAYRDGNVINDYDFSNKIKWGEQEEVLSNKWKGKNALVIGDSITAAGKWQLKLKENLGMNVTTHAKGGIGIIAMTDGDKGLGGDYDNETNAGGEIKPLDANKVKDKDLIVILPAYNERGTEYGQLGDLYPNQSTIIGMMQYQINRVYEELTKANNLNCKVLIATPHCAGKYNYVDADGYEQYPTNSGRTMQTLSNTIKEICNYNNIPVCDLWHNSGINRFTWNIHGANTNAVNDTYTKYELNAQGEIVGQTPLRYVKGLSYYQIRNGQAVLEEYTGSAPYPFNGDQLHCSPLGYARIGECIVGSVIQYFGY